MTKLTSKINEIVLINPATGHDFFPDFAKNDIGIVYCEEADAYMSDQNTFSYWSRVVKTYQPILNRWYMLLHDAPDDTEDKMYADYIALNWGDDVTRYATLLSGLCDRYTT